MSPDPMRCADCPVAKDVPCIGESAPVFCGWAAGGDAVKRQHVVLRSGLGGEMPERSVAVTPTGEVPAVPSLAGIPLAGDLMKAAAEKLGADRLASYISGKLGVDCGCPARQAALNRLDAKLRKWLGWG
jgi:hypothetical protein